ncbi:MAG: TetR/AcrR family transcriptional regulator [Eubacteriales bacterium]
MGEKSEQKRQLILRIARKVFVAYGYKNVTMQDIVEACDISRGGLYLYFSSPKEIFESVLEFESQETDDIFTGKISQDATSADILALFLKEQKKEILKDENTLLVAMYEYFFENKAENTNSLIRQQFDMAVKVIQTLIQNGVESGEFDCEDSLAMAETIMYLLEGLKITSQTMGISEADINKQLLFVLKGLVKDAKR